MIQAYLEDILEKLLETKALSIVWASSAPSRKLEAFGKVRLQV